MAIVNSGAAARRSTCLPLLPGEVADEVEVAVHGVLPHLLGDLFVVEQAAQLLEAVVAEPPSAAAQGDDDGALEEAVEVDDEVVGTAAERPVETRASPAGGPRSVPAGTPSARSCGAR